MLRVGIVGDQSLLTPAATIGKLVPGVIRSVLLTVPNLDPLASPWREAMGLAKYLPRDRFRLTICALRPDGVAESAASLEALGVKCFVARFRPRGTSLRRVLESVRDRKCLGDHGPFDIQHSMDFTSSPFEAFMSRRHARVFLFSQRNMNWGGSRLMLRAKAGLARKITCVSDAVLGFMKGSAPSSRLVRIYPGVDADSIPWRLPRLTKTRPLQILMVGHITRLKRFEDGIKALAEVAHEFPDLNLAIAGAPTDEAYLRELQRQVQSSGLADRVSFLGPRRDVLELMAESDVLLHTAETEAFGMVLIEAMAMGLPVIAPAIEGPKEIVEDQVSGLLVPRGEIGRYAEAIRALVQNPERCRQLSAGARKQVETRFTARRMAQEIAAVYESLLPPAGTAKLEKELSVISNQ